MPDILSTEKPNIAPSATSDMPVVVPAAEAAPAAATPETNAPAPNSADAPVTSEDQAQDATATPAQDDAAEEAEARKKPWFQKRIDELTSKRHEAERKAKEESDRRAELERQLALRNQPVPELPENTPEPQRDQFEDYDAYVEARADWRAQQTVMTLVRNAQQQQQQRDEQFAQDQARQRAAQLHQAHLTRAEQAKQQLPDYDQVARRDDIFLSQPLYQAILESDSSPAILYHIGKNPEEATRLNGLSPLSAAREIGLLQARLQEQSKPKVSSTPKPIDPVGSRSNARERPLAELSMEEYAARRMQQLRPGKAKGARAG